MTMTAPQHDAETTSEQAGTENAHTEQADTKQEIGQFTTRQKVQRCWFVTLGLLGGFGFVTSQMSIAIAETNFAISDYSSEAGEFTASATGADNSGTAADYTATHYIEAAPAVSYPAVPEATAYDVTTYSVSASDLSLEPANPPVAASTHVSAPVPEAFIEAPAVPAEVVRALAPAATNSTAHEQAISTAPDLQQPAFTVTESATPAVVTPTVINFAITEANATDNSLANQPSPTTSPLETAVLEADNLEAAEPEAVEPNAAVVSFEISPAAVPSAVVPTVTPVAPPAFTQESKLSESKVASNRPARSMSGFMESSTVAAPLSAYSHAQANLSQGLLLANLGNARSLRSAEPTLLAMGDEPALEAPTAADIAPTPAPEVVPAPVPEIMPEPAPVISAPAPAAPPIIDIAPAAEAPPIQPTEIVPAALPEGSSLPEEYNNIFVDPTDYSVGATETPTAEGPSVVVSEQSTGCEFTISQQGGVPNGACGSVAGGAVTGGGYNAPTAQNLPQNSPQNLPQNSEWQAPIANTPVANAPVARSAANAPVSYNPAGIQLSTSAAGRDYLNRSVRPLVNLQAAEQFIFPLAVPSPITSLFGFRIHPIHGDQRFHAGTDIGAEQGTPVLAAQDGVVAGAAYSGGYGLLVVLQHELEEVQLESRYAHLAEIFVEPGKQVKKGDIIGLVGSTGNSTGPHLHFEMRQMTADGWVLVNADGLVQSSLANLVKALNNPMQTLSFNFSDFNLSNLRAGGSIKAPNASNEIPTFPGNNGIPYRPAQPNAS